MVSEEREKERIGRKLKALDREVGRLIDAYQAEVIDLADLKERRERIEEHGRMLKRRLSEIHEKRAEREQEVRLLRGLEQFSKSVAGALEDPSFETKQQVLRLVVDRIVVEDARVVVHHVVPTGPVGLQTRHLTVTHPHVGAGENRERSIVARDLSAKPGAGRCRAFIGGVWFAALGRPCRARANWLGSHQVRSGRTRRRDVFGSASAALNRV